MSMYRFSATCVVVASVGFSFAAPLLPGYLTDASAGSESREKGGYVTPAHLRYPYVSTYYVEPTVIVGECVKIGWYATDWAHSKVRFNDDSARFDVTVRYSQDLTNWCEKIARDVKSGDGTFDLGPLAVGEWTLSVQAKDLRNGLPSHVVWHEFRVVEKDELTIPASRVYRMTASDLKAYGIRNDGDYGRLVLLPTPTNAPVLTAKKLLDRDDLGRKFVEECLAAHPHVDAKRPGYAVYVPSEDGKPVSRSFMMRKVVYDRGYDRARVASDATNTVRGLQRFLDEKASAGFRKVVLLPGTYRLSHVSALRPPSRLTLDLNGATLKLDGFTGCGATMVAIDGVTDSVLENGIVEGDYYEHDYEHSPKNSEWVHGVTVNSCSKYCTVRDVTIRDIVGHGGGNGCGSRGAPGSWFTYSNDRSYNNRSMQKSKGVSWSVGGLRTDGTVDKADTNRYTSSLISVESMKPFKYLTVSKCSGYQGMRTRNWNLTVAYYDAEGRFVSSEIVQQFRVSLVPPAATQARLSIEVSSQEEADRNDMSMMLWKMPQNCRFERCRFEHCRAVGYAMSQCRNHLIADCTFTRCGETLARCAFDAEDGWDGMQDATFRGNTFFDNPNNELLTCGGLNFIFEGNRCSLYLWPKTHSPCVRSNDLGSATFACESRNRTGYGRYCGNVHRGALDVGGKYESADWFAAISDTDFSKAPDSFKAASGVNGRFVGCTFADRKVTLADAAYCTVRNCQGAFIPSSTWYAMDFEGGELVNWYARNRIVRSSFKGVRLHNFSKGKQTFEDCTFEDCAFTMLTQAEIRFVRCTFRRTKAEAGWWAKPNKLDFSQCKIEMPDGGFLRLPQYSVGIVAWKDCMIGGGEKPAALLDLYDLRPYERENDVGVVTVTGCKFGKGVRCLVDSARPSGKDSKQKMVVDISASPLPQGVQPLGANASALLNWEVRK